MENIYYTYQLRDPRSNLPFYIGKGKGYRAWEHFKDNSGSHKANTINKIINEGFEVQVEILYKNLPETIAFALEKLLIKKHGRRNIRTGILTNMTDGGEGTSGFTLTGESKLRHKEACKTAMQRPETKAKISATSKGRFVSEDTKELNRQRSTGENNPMFGKTGDKSPIKGRKNVHHPETREMKLIPGDQVEHYISIGWSLGRLPETVDHQRSKGHKSIYHPETREVKFITTDKIDEYLFIGWKLGRTPKLPTAK